MKLIFKSSSVMILLMVSSTVFAEWTIPGASCVSENYFDATYASGNAIENPLKPDPNKNTRMNVFCTSTIFNSYGDNLDITFYVRNTSKEENLSCEGFSLDIQGNVVQQTEKVTVEKNTKGLIKLTARQKHRYDNGEPVVIGTKCTLPDRGKSSPSQLVSVRIY